MPKSDAEVMLVKGVLNSPAAEHAGKMPTRSRVQLTGKVRWQVIRKVSETEHTGHQVLMSCLVVGLNAL